MDDYPDETDIRTDSGRYVGQRVTVGGVMQETDPVALDVETGDTSTRLTVENISGRTWSPPGTNTPVATTFGSRRSGLETSSTPRSRSSPCLLSRFGMVAR